MPNSPDSPRGFCPNCGYPIDPGICPECGRRATPESLAKIPPRLRLRRRLRRIALLVIIVAVVGGTYWTWHHVNWVRWLPTSWLLAMQGDEWDRYMVELDSRWQAGVLTPRQQQQMLDKALLIPSNLDVTSPAPRDTELFAEVRIRPRPPLTPYLRGGIFGSFGQLEAGPWTLRIDGPLFHESVTSSKSFDNMCPIIGFEVPSLQPGSYTLTATGNYRFEKFNALGSQSPRTVLYEWPVTVKQQLTVEDRPLSTFVRAVWSQQSAVDLAGRLRAVLTRDDHGCELSLSVAQPDCSLAYEIWMRAPGENAFSRLGTETEGPALICSSSEHFRIVTTARDDGLSGTTHVELRLVPSAQLAFNADFAEYFNAIVEWKALPVVGNLESAAEAAGTPPTEVLEFDTPSSQADTPQ